METEYKGKKYKLVEIPEDQDNCCYGCCFDSSQGRGECVEPEELDCTCEESTYDLIWEEVK